MWSHGLSWNYAAFWLKCQTSQTMKLKVEHDKFGKKKKTIYNPEYVLKFVT